MKVIKLDKKTYQLTVSEEVAAVLVTIFENVGGDPKDSPRAVSDRLRQLLVDAYKGKTNATGRPFRRFTTEGGGINFFNCSMEKLKNEILQSLEGCEKK